MSLTDFLRIGITADDKTGKGIKSAKNNITGLEKNVKSLAKTLGVALSAAAVVNFGKASVKAFMEDEKAASRLAKTVENLGLGFANPEIARFIDQLSAASGVADDNLRPALQALITTTGSVAKSQELLSQAIDISAGSGEALTTVSQDLANAYVGNVKGLKKYNLGLTQTELKTMSFTDVQKKLNDQFTGSNAAYLETYAGKMQALNTAAGEAQETIGKGLVDAFSLLTGSMTGADLSTWVGNASKKIYDLEISLAHLAFTTKSIFNPKYWKNGGTEQIQKDWEDMLNKLQYAGAKAFDPANNSLMGYKKDEAARIQAEKDAKQRAKELAALLKKQTAEQKKQALLKKQGTLFDMEQIQLIAALKGKLSDEDRKRVELQLALLQGNEEAAAKLSTQLANSIDKTGNLAKYLQTLPDANNPFKNWDAYLTAIEERVKKITGNTPNGGGSTGSIIGDVNNPTYTVGGTAGANGGSYGGQVQVSVNFQGADSLSQALRDSFISASADGSFSQINRTVGAFDR